MAPGRCAGVQVHDSEPLRACLTGLGPGNVSGMAQDLNELFDVVDEQDRVVGQATRGDVHAQKLLHRAIHVFIFNAAGKLFLQKRSLAKDKSPGLWSSSCSGHLDAGEDYDEAAWRELGEELGLRFPKPLLRWLRFNPCEETEWEFVWVYRTVAEGPFTLNPAEIERGEWVTVDELDRRLSRQPEQFTSSFRLVWAEARTRV